MYEELIFVFFDTFEFKQVEVLNGKNIQKG